MPKIHNIMWDDSFKSIIYDAVDLLYEMYISHINVEDFFKVDRRVELLYNTFNEIIEGDLVKIENGEIVRNPTTKEVDLKRVRFFECLRDIVCTMMIDKFYRDRFFYFINSLVAKDDLYIEHGEADLYR